MKDKPPYELTPHPTYRKRCAEMLQEFDELDPDDQEIAILFMKLWRNRKAIPLPTNTEIRILGSEDSTASFGK